MSPGRINEIRVPGGRGPGPDPTGKAVLSGLSGGVRRQPGLPDVAEVDQTIIMNSIESLVPGIQTGICSPSTYEAEIRKKDELIAALIHELEQAVEKLDRFDRLGNDHAHLAKSSPGNSAQTFSGPLSPLMENLQRMAEEWEQSQPQTQLERIESQLAAMHELMIDLHRSDRGRPQSYEPEGNGDDAEEIACDTTIEESSPTWDAIKSQIFANEPAPQVGPAQLASENTELLRLIGETPAPTPVDFSLATPETLQQAVVERDAYIIQMNRLIRMHNSFVMPKDWAQLGNVPAEMQQRVDSLIQHLDVQVRLGEVEMSLERARLARERSRLQTEREQIDKHLRRLGLNSIAELDEISTSSSSSVDRRFMRFIGPKLK